MVICTTTACTLHAWTSMNARVTMEAVTRAPTAPTLLAHTPVDLALRATPALAQLAARKSITVAHKTADAMR